MGTALAMSLLVAMIFGAGAMWARNQIMHNMMADLVSAKDMLNWLKLFGGKRRK